MPVARILSVLESIPRRTPAKINSFNYFVKEILTIQGPRNRPWQKKQLEKIVRRIRDHSVGRGPSASVAKLSFTVPLSWTSFEKVCHRVINVDQGRLLAGVPFEELKLRSSERSLKDMSEDYLANDSTDGGRELFYVSLDPPKMMKVGVGLGPDITLGRPRPLFDFQFVRCSPVRGYDLRRDGRRFLCTRLKQRPQIDITRLTLVLNWLEELKRLAPTS